MENRWGSRTLSAFDAIIDYRPFGLIRGTIRDYSASGVYFQTETRSIPLYISIKLVLLVPDRRITHMQAVRAQVARRDGRGLGLAFIEIEKHTLRILRHMQIKTRHRHFVPQPTSLQRVVRRDPNPAVTSTHSNTS